MSKKIYWFLIVTFLTSVGLQAQNDNRKELLNQKRGITYDSELTGNIKLMTNGWSIGGHYGLLKKWNSTTLYTVEFGELKHFKESRQRADYSVSAFGRSASSFTYGKQNSFFTLRAGLGQKRYFSEKARRKGVAVGMFYNFGPSLGIIKPYYLEVTRLEQGTNRVNINDVRYSENTAQEFLNKNRIYGSSSIAMGLNEINLAVGAHAKLALHLDWGAFEEHVKALEVGIAADFYFQKIPIMVSDDNRPYFINLYAALQLGKRK